VPVRVQLLQVALEGLLLVGREDAVDLALDLARAQALRLRLGKDVLDLALLLRRQVEIPKGPDVLNGFGGCCDP